MLLLSFYLIQFFFHEIYFYFFMFRDVPGCSGMFRDVPGCSGMFRFYRRPFRLGPLALFNSIKLYSKMRGNKTRVKIPFLSVTRIMWWIYFIKICLPNNFDRFCLIGGKAGNPRMARNMTYKCDAAWAWVELRGAGRGVETAYDTSDIIIIAGLPYKCTKTFSVFA